MSTIKVNNIVPPNVGEGVSIDGLQMPTAGALSNRNLIMNGAMQVAQRGTQSTSITTSNYYVVDRYEFGIGSLGTWTIDQSTDAPDDFSKSLKHTCTTAVATPAAGSIALITHNIEAQNLQHLNFGTSNAKPLVLSFWVKSNKAGDASIGLMQPDASNRLFSTSYNISAADTWEYKTIQIPADTGGTIDDNSNKGLRIDWYLNSGSTFSGGSYQTWGVINNANRNVSNLGVGGAVNDYLQITGVQLEVGSKATPFEHESYGQTLAKCQRYFYSAYNAAVDGTADASLCTGLYYNTNRFFGVVHFPTTMRIAPTLTASSGANGEFAIFRNATSNSLSTLTAGDESLNSAEVQATSSQNAVGTKNWPGFLRAVGNTSYVFFEAEL